MKLYEAKLIRSGWSGVLALAILILPLSLLIAVLLTVSDPGQEWFTVVAIFVLWPIIVVIITILALKASRKIYIDLSPGLITVICPRRSLLRGFALDIRFPEITKLIICDNYRGPDTILLNLNNNVKLMIDPSWPALNKIEPFSNVNFQQDFLSAIEQYNNTSNLPIPFTAKQRSHWLETMELIVDFLSIFK